MVFEGTSRFFPSGYVIDFRPACASFAFTEIVTLPLVGVHDVGLCVVVAVGLVVSFLI